MLKEIKVSQQSQKYIAVQTTLAHVRIYNNINIDKIDVSTLHPTEQATFEYRFGRELALSIFEELKEAGHTPFLELHIRCVFRILMVLNRRYWNLN